MSVQPEYRDKIWRPPAEHMPLLSGGGVRGREGVVSSSYTPHYTDISIIGGVWVVYDYLLVSGK